MTTHEFAAGGYRFIPGPFQYSGGVAALRGYQIQRVRFRRPVPLVRGFELVAEAIRNSGRPLTAFCACELRSPAPFTEQGFRAFNEGPKDNREIDFIKLRQMLAAGHPWDNELLDSILPR